MKAIVFLGQFGGSSAYLKKRMANSLIAKQVKIRHSQSGKLDVVKGAIAERLVLDECFVRQYKTSKSYGTLVTLLYGNDVRKLFPNPQQHGAPPFEKSDDGLWLKVIEWAIPKVCIFIYSAAQIRVVWSIFLTQKGTIMLVPSLQATTDVFFFGAGHRYTEWSKL